MSERLTLDELKENFLFFDDWEEKYTYLIDLGKQIDGVDDVHKVDAYKIEGCVSRVWLVPEGTDEVVSFKADSDAMIVRGLIAILMSAYDGQSRDDIMSVDINGFFSEIGLDQHLSPNRRNGFFAMVERIKSL